MSYSIISGIGKIDRGKWEFFIRKNTHGSIFQSPEMFDLYAGLESYHPIILAVSDGNDSLAGLLLAVIIEDYKSLFGRLTARCVVHGGPLIGNSHPDSSALASLLLDELVKQVKDHCLYIQFRNLFDTGAMEVAFVGKSFIMQPHLNLIIPTPATGDAIRNISSGKLRQVKQSIQAGVEVVKAASESEVHEFYHLLKKLYRFKVKKPLAPEEFFQSFFKSSQQGKLGFIMLAKYQGQVIGGMVCPLSPARSLTEWYICGLDKKWKNVHPSVLLTYKAIEYASQNNIPVFDFMGIGSPDKPYGVREFKMRFGGNVVQYGRYLRINNRLLYPMAKAGLSILAWFRLL